MSNRRRARRRTRLPMPEPGPGENYALQPAAVPDRLDQEAVESAHTLTHDLLIEIWGAKRKSRIWWTEHFGAEAASQYRDIHRLLGHTVPDDVEPILDDNPRLYVVVAWAIVDEGDPPNPVPPAQWFDSSGAPS